MIKVKVQLFDDASGKDIGEQKIVSPEACTIYSLPNEEPIAEFEFNFTIEYPENSFGDITHLNGSIIKTHR